MTTTAITIGIAALTMISMAVVLSYILGWASKAFHVESDPRVEEVLEALPGANCGGCGYLGCSEYAVAVVTDNAPVHKCPVGGESCAVNIAAIMGVDAGKSMVFRAIVHCGADGESHLGRVDYRGEHRCAAAQFVAGIQGCTFGCLGFGDCVNACNYDAIHVVDDLAVVDYDKCVGCGACAKACPRHIISIENFIRPAMPVVACSNTDKGKDVSSVCQKGCIGCKACSRLSDVFPMKGDLAVADYNCYGPDAVEGVEKALEKCPRDCIKFVGKLT
ncbi:MAG TPA: RnfABCDGE type electron transport complex subunit B [Desulfobacteraceae bacterium]|nr:RnfABCDGE type electron transport complex subunit B [Desulfobacteraceae bacterium]